MSDLARRLSAIVAGMRGRTILVVGDLIVDEYLFGKPARISRDDPRRGCTWSPPLPQLSSCFRSPPAVRARRTRTITVPTTLPTTLAQVGLPAGSTGP